MSIENITNGAGNAGLTASFFTASIGFITENSSAILVLLGIATFVVGTIFKYLHWRLEKKKFEHESRANH